MHTTDTVPAVLTVFAAILLLIRFGLFLHLHLVRRDLSPLRNTVSDLGTGRSRREFTVMGVLTAVAYTLLLLVYLMRDIGPTVYLVVLAVGIAALVVMLSFPTDLTGTDRTRTGRLHLLLAVVQFAGIFVGTVNLDLTPVMSADLQEALRWVLRISFYAFLATLILPGLRRHLIGLTERILVTVVPLWFLVVAVVLLVA